MIRRALLSLIVFSSAGLAGAAPVRELPIRESAETLYRYAGLERQVPELGAQIEQQLRSDSSAIPAAALERMSAAARRAFDGKRMKAEILADLRAAWNPTLANEALKWLRSPVGRQVIQMEERASTPEAQRALESFAASLATTPPDPKRLAGVRRLDQATRATDISVEILSTMARAIARSAVAAHPGPASPEAIDREIAAQHPAMREAVESYTLAAFLYTYRDLSPRDFAEYLAFFDSPGGKWYQQTVGAAFQRAVNEASERFAAELVTIMASEPRR
jgi:hypothetical protein